MLPLVGKHFVAAKEAFETAAETADLAANVVPEQVV